MESIFDSVFVQPPGAWAEFHTNNRKPKKKCPPGKILRKGYTTKSGRNVQPTCVKDTGRKGKGRKTLPPVSKAGALRQFGYSTKLSAAARRAALTRSIRSMGKSKSAIRDKALKVYRRLILIHNFSSRSNPKAAAIYKSDYKWIKKRYLE